MFLGGRCPQAKRKISWEIQYAIDMLSMCCRYSVGVFSPCGANSQNKCRPELVRRSREANSSKIIASETQPVLGTSVFKS